MDLLEYIKKIRDLLKTPKVRVVNFCSGIDHQRMLGEEQLAYFNCGKLLISKDCAHNVASDIIESNFGYTKERMSSSKNNGFTSYVLVLPLHLNI